MHSKYIAYKGKCGNVYQYSVDVAYSVIPVLYNTNFSICKNKYLWYYREYSTCIIVNSKFYLMFRKSMTMTRKASGLQSIQYYYMQGMMN